MKRILFISFCFLLLCGCEIKFDNNSKEILNGLGVPNEAFTNGSEITLTKEKYDQVNIGISYEDLKNILGGECELQYEHTGSYGTSSTYTCWDKDDSSKRALFDFENGKLDSKTQTGLE